MTKLIELREYEGELDVPLRHGAVCCSFVVRGNTFYECLEELQAVFPTGCFEDIRIEPCGTEIVRVSTE